MRRTSAPIDDVSVLTVAAFVANPVGEAQIVVGDVRTTKPATGQHGVEEALEGLMVRQPNKDFRAKNPPQLGEG